VNFAKLMGTMGSRAIIGLVPWLLLAVGGNALAAAGPPPQITVQPVDQTVLKGETAVFHVEAKSATRLTYQWRENGKKVAGATNNTYTITSARKDGVYSVLVANAAGSVTSSNAVLTVINVIVPPVGNNDGYYIQEDSPANVSAPGILSNDVTSSGTPLIALLEGNVSHGTLRLSIDGSFQYTPLPDFNGNDTFTYRPADGVSTGNVATVTISVVPVNDAPTARNDSFTIAANTSAVLDVLANDTDIEGDALTITAVSGTVGTVETSGKDVSFAPPAGFSGIATFDYAVCDGTLLATGRVTASVLPAVQADAYSLDMNVPLTVSGAGVLANDSGSATEDLKVFLAGNTSHGSVVLNADGTFTYVPSAHYFGMDSFTYRAYNSSVTSAVATVSLTIRDPTPLRIVSMALTPQGFALQITGPQVGDYVILRSTNLAGWTPIATNAVTTGMLLFTDPDAATAPLGFYGAKLQ
jgi:hypothetical protein